MTRTKRIKIAHEACELFYNERLFSCDAIRRIESLVKDGPFVLDYRAFYEKPIYDWGFSATTLWEIGRHERIMCVLFWATCPEDIRKGVMG